MEEIALASNCRSGNVRNTRRSLLALTAVTLVTAGATGRVAPVWAQDATPAPLGFELAPGVTAEDVAPPNGSPALSRIQIAAGTTWAASNSSDPTIALVFIEAGSLTLQVAAPISVNRAAASGKPAEAIAANTPVEVAVGDFFIAPPFAAATIRNDGATPASFIIAGIVPPSAAAGPVGTPAN